MRDGAAGRRCAREYAIRVFVSCGAVKKMPGWTPRYRGRVCTGVLGSILWKRHGANRRGGEVRLPPLIRLTGQTHR
jgi:hypothetical protein